LAIEAVERETKEKEAEAALVKEERQRNETLWQMQSALAEQEEDLAADDINFYEGLDNEIEPEDSNAQAYDYEFTDAHLQPPSWYDFNNNKFRFTVLR